MSGNEGDAYPAWDQARIDKLSKAWSALCTTWDHAYCLWLAKGLKAENERLRKLIWPAGASSRTWDKILAVAWNSQDEDLVDLVGVCCDLDAEVWRLHSELLLANEEGERLLKERLELKRQLDESRRANEILNEDRKKLVEDNLELSSEVARLERDVESLREEEVLWAAEVRQVHADWREAHAGVVFERDAWRQRAEAQPVVEADGFPWWCVPMSAACGAAALQVGIWLAPKLVDLCS